MNIDSIKNGYVIDHISAGKSMQIYELLGLGELDCPVALIKNAPSRKSGKKDIIKIDGDIVLNMDVLGFVDPGVCVNRIKNGEIIEKRTIDSPELLKNVIRCKNPRCITSCEQEIEHIFRLTDSENKVYRCIYCETRGTL